MATRQWIPFWRLESLSKKEQSLFAAVLGCHGISALRENVSAQIARACAASSASYTQSLASAILSTGGIHAPIEQTMNLLNHDDPGTLVGTLLAAGYRIPGWGNDFVKGRRDDDWIPVDDIIKFGDWIEVRDKLEAITKALHKAGKDIYPNPSAYTAAAALILKMPPNMAQFLFFAGRLESWSAIINHQLNQPRPAPSVENQEVKEHQEALAN